MTLRSVHQRLDALAEDLLGEHRRPRDAYALAQVVHDDPAAGSTLRADGDRAGRA